MRTFALLIACVVCALPATAHSSQIRPISLRALEAKATLVVMGVVTRVLPEGDRDFVTVHTTSTLKGECPSPAVTFWLVTRGGLKDFDPAVKVGDSGVFFLTVDPDSKAVEKAYWGSVALFPKNHFRLDPQPGNKQPE